jgi:FKBP-type peptidyl-prolyl cis-trans isomerase 2
VDYATSDGTATAGSDYTAASGTLTFAPGETNKTFAVTALDDALVEADETVILTLSNAVNAALGIPNPATLTILDDDTLPTVQFAQAEFFEDEDKDKAVITVTLSRAYDLQVTVDFATSDGTATAGEDYTAASGTLTFAPGEVSQTFEVPLLDDLLDEPFESVNLTLSNPVNATLGAPNPATLYIVDNDGLPTVWFSAFTYEVDEDAGTATITVLLEPDSALEVKVDYATSDGTATAGSDYTASAGTLTFAPGEDSQTFTVPILEDSLQESDETVLLTLSNPLNAVIGLPNPAPLTIVDNDAPPTVQFSSAAYSKSENGGGVATITVNLSAISGQQVTVNYSTADGTATAGADYTAASGMLTFAPGQLTQTFEVTILEDELDEADETVSLTLHDPVNATLGSPSQATLNILDNDAPPSVQFSSANFSANEDAGTATISVALSAASGQVVTVDYATSDGTATAGSDYLAASGTLTFAPGVVSQTFTVPLLADTFDELDETVVLTLSEPSNAGLGFPNPATLTIVDTNIPPTVQFEAAIYTVLEGAGTATVTVTLNVASAQQVTVDFATTDESASAGEDYTAASGTLTFASGETSQTFTVAILDDFFVETDETVLLNLANPSNATLGLSSADLTIVNDDIYRVLTAVFIVSVAGK